MRAMVTTAHIELGPLSRVALPSRLLSSRSRDRERHGFHEYGGFLSIDLPVLEVPAAA
jgi:hypothetical protein